MLKESKMSDTRPAFTVGGPVPLGPAYAYVKRPADDQLLNAVRSRKYCNVFAPYQMGKSSLMAHIADHLREKEGVPTAVIDLAETGIDLDADEWYLSLVTGLKEQLGLTEDVHAWWDKHTRKGMGQRFADFLETVVLKETAGPVVIFVDGIEATLSLPFTDGFFAAIRAAYEARADDPAYKRLTFVLLGVARSAGLIKDRSRTPYDIGLSVDLGDFSPEEAKKYLQPGLETDAISAEQADRILKRVLDWTGGHPYLTQKVCAEIVAMDVGPWTDDKIDERVDGLVRSLFLSDKAPLDSNLRYISDCILRSRAREKLLRRPFGWMRRIVLGVREMVDRGKLLRIYGQVLSGESVTDDAGDPIKDQLKLAGLLRATPQDTLAVRNRIYAAFFDRRWTKEAMDSVNRARIGVAVASAAAIVMAAMLLHSTLTSDCPLPENRSFEKVPPILDLWSFDGEVQLVTPGKDLDYAAQLGTPVPQTDQPTGEVQIYQEIVIPTEWKRPELTFWYRMFTNDVYYISKFRVHLEDLSNGEDREILYDGFRPCHTPYAPTPGCDLDWRKASYDLNGYQGKTVRLVFEDRNDEYVYEGTPYAPWGIWTQVDDVCIRDAGPTPTQQRVYLPVIMSSRCDPDESCGPGPEIIIGGALSTPSGPRPIRPPAPP
jgi:hypothetical protein